MTVAAGQFPLIGAQPVSNSAVNGVEVATALSGYVPLIPVGTIITVNDPYWGGLELVRLTVPVSTTVYPGTMSTLTDTYGYVPVPNTALLGQPVAYSYNYVVSNATFVQYAWFVIGGKFVVNSTASIAANTAYGIVAAGQGGALAAGKQINSSRVYLPATTTLTKVASTTNGTPYVRVSNTDGMFVGMALSGTGIPASAAIGSIDSSGTLIGMVTAGGVVALNATATGSITLTGTFNDATRFWNIVVSTRPAAQGPIT